ncbi:hypothetical protein DICSQDRAFT_139525 [Dichomitus squalens LYAD-421 SS1]|uniref:Uncharacterized protein n=1 Tax=Dichomitus squalens (strain LYAD-421) TaxID=732165 RepID=R7SQE8_DICSQ|nr:uncharacterized protein DICSQDRAFT_139525 [Dichomitus squalens LYAD-421 SS1]EJF58306.1 hypothetical protein DICSQDRAFT_139525 [Dichomitus squalens LYAD-421 SS1]
MVQQPSPSRPYISLRVGRSYKGRITAPRHSLLHQTDGHLGEWFDGIRKGSATLVVEAEGVDVIATVAESVLGLAQGSTLKVMIAGGKEAHRVAQKLGDVGVGVTLTAVHNARLVRVHVFRAR